VSVVEQRSYHGTKLDPEQLIAAAHDAV
jgi:hypothetical protein